MSTRTLVLVPGLCSDASVWRRTIDALGDGVDCRVADTLQDGTLEGMARRLLDQAPSSFFLAGVSMGGMVALETMRIAPERVAALALVGTNARSDTFRQKTFRRLTNAVVRAAPDFGRLASRNLKSLVHSSVLPVVRNELLEMSVRVGAETYVRQNRAVLARDDLRKLLPRVTAPTIVIVGRDDRVTPVALSEEIHALIPASTIHVVADCGHLPPIEKPAIVADLFRRSMATFGDRPKRDSLGEVVT